MALLQTVINSLPVFLYPPCNNTGNKLMSVNCVSQITVYPLLQHYTRCNLFKIVNGIRTRLQFIPLLQGL